MGRYGALALLVAASIGWAAHTARAQTSPAVVDSAVDLVWGLGIPLRDGVRLNGTVYRPHGQTAPLPVVFTFTPYIGDTYHPRAMYFARHGYVYVLIDVRGRGNSGGAFEPFANEGKDGYDVVEWLARQPWCNGKVAMWGGSYAGYDQWTVLKELPPHLSTIVPAAAAHAAVDFPFFANIFGSYDIQWLTFTSGVTGNDHLFGESSFWTEKFSEMYRAHLPFRTLDSLVGNTTTVWRKWLAHPEPDAYWDAMAPTPAQYQAIRVPILTITGSYDDDQPGALSYYAEDMRHGDSTARAQHYLIIGPWDHPGTRTPMKEVGGLTFGDASVLDLNALHTEWYDWTMKSGPRPAFLRKRVAYYVIGPGAEYWKYADRLDGIATATRTLRLASVNGHADDALHSGMLGDSVPASSPPDHYVYDPLDIRPGALERAPADNWITDATRAMNLFGGGVVYTSAPFAASTEVTGHVSLAVWLSLDVPDTDLEADLYEILPDGSSVHLTGTMMRARYRRSVREPRLVTPGAIERYDFPGFTWFSRQVSAGSRLRLVIRSPNSINLEKNYNSGGVVADESGADARTAHVTVYHDAAHPSALTIPIVR